jgi:hypothetical protein
MLEFFTTRRRTKPKKHPALVGVGGFSAEVGKTTLICDLLRSFPEWEAIKMSRGHFQSCDHEGQACGASHLLSNEPLIKSGRDETYLSGTDTAQYWDAGAANVHLVVATEEQVSVGLTQALERVAAAGVFVEGNRFTPYLKPDFLLMVAPPDGGTIRPSARRALEYTTALYINEPNGDSHRARQRFASWVKDASAAPLIGKLPIFTHEDLPDVVAHVWAAQLDHPKRVASIAW